MDGWAKVVTFGTHVTRNTKVIYNNNRASAKKAISG